MLEGVRVLDFSRLLPGAYCTLLLADLGADVIKVEQAGRGDPLRAMPGGPVYFDALHRGKRSVALRFKTPAGQAAIRKLVAASDVLVEGFRPGVMEKMGLGYEDLSRQNRRLVYCAITGYSSNGPLRDRAGHDLNYLALGGPLSLMPKTAQGIPAIPSIQAADLGGAVTAAMAILAALFEREHTSHGRRLEVPMFDVVQSWIGHWFAGARAHVAGLDLTGGLPCYHVYRVQDGFLTVAALETPFWLTFCDVIGRPDLGPRQADSSAIDEVQAILAPRTRDQWVAAFAGRDACVEPCLSLEEVLAWGVPQGAPILLAGDRPTASGPAPSLGEHTLTVLEECGLSPAEIAAATRAAPEEAR